MDRIRLDDIKVFAYHGATTKERDEGQYFYVSVDLYTDTTRAVASDNLTYTVNYASVCDFISKFMITNKMFLIETVASELAVRILKTFSGVMRADVEIKKPEAPMPAELNYVSVSVSRRWHEAILSIGSNMGNKQAYLDMAISAFKSDDNCKDIVTSRFITTKPYGATIEQDDFVNAAIKINTLYTPHQLLNVIHEVEQSAGRERTIHWGPRTLDIDIIMYDDLVIYEDNLIIPHYDMHRREFVLRPVAEIAPYKIHPIYKKTMQELYEELEN
ncbi:MAG: 2-amino-4-hydroxy-6-hydroxymethyldihydropteridine diphosphokinase [Eubacterium sp.]